MESVLAIDDDRSVLRLVERALSKLGVSVHTAAHAREGLQLLQERKPDVLLLDIMLPETSGIQLAKEIRELDARLPIIFITARDDSDMAIEAMKLGAYDYLLKPLDVQQVQELVERALKTRRLMQSPVHLEEADVAEEGDVLLGRSPQMLEVYKQIGRVAAQDVTVMIRGETGTGKELVARALYQHSQRRDRCFLAVNCAALSDTLLESELFGHEKGAFTGADRRRIGKFEQCGDGTLFLDEVGDMSPLTQSKVLRLLQERKFERLGGSETIQVDVRLISATNAPLEQMIEAGQFRLDLYHRLNAFEIHLPPLRERRGDIELLLNHFLARFNKQFSKSITGISPEALKLLVEYPWPGNIRELQGVVRKSVLMATGPVVIPEFLPPEVHASDRPTQPQSDEDGPTPPDLARFIDDRGRAGSEDLYAETLAVMERYLLTRVLREASGNQSKAAARLGITRGSLRHKIKTLGIYIEQVVESVE